MSTRANSEKPAPLSSGSLYDYITGLWKLGGIPLVLIGLGALNLFLPISGYSSDKQFLITVSLFIGGVVVWLTVTIVTFKRWKHDTELRSAERAKIIDSVTKVMETGESDTVKSKLPVLKDFLQSLGFEISQSHTADQ